MPMWTILFTTTSIGPCGTEQSVTHALCIGGHVFVVYQASIVLYQVVCFFHSIIIFALFFSLSLLVITDPRSHTRLFSPAVTSTVRALHFYRDKISAFSSLVDSRRMVCAASRIKKLFA